MPGIVVSVGRDLAGLVNARQQVSGPIIAALAGSAISIRYQVQAATHIVAVLGRMAVGICRLTESSGPIMAVCGRATQRIGHVQQAACGIIIVAGHGTTRIRLRSLCGRRHRNCKLVVPVSAVP